jgi:hypothetical protein
MCQTYQELPEDECERFDFARLAAEYHAGAGVPWDGHAQLVQELVRAEQLYKSGTPWAAELIGLISAGIDRYVERALPAEA